jgi:CheY-like chemotaxis protein
MSKPESILIIDDDPGITDSLSMLLEDEGYRIAVEPNGSKGLEYLAQNELPSLIILDVMMPVLDGFGFRQKQLEDARIANIPVLLMTAGTLDQRIRGLNATAFLRKPIDIDQLLQAISSSF